MKQKIVRYAVLLGCLATSGAVLMKTSQHVQNAEDKQAAIEREIEKEKRRIAVLKAEWSYLNAPQRLEILASDLLDLAAPDTSDRIIESAGTLPESSEEAPFMVPQPVLYKLRKPERWQR